MKRIVLSLVLLMSCFYFTVSSSADQKRSAPKEQVLVYSEQCPEEMLEYACENFDSKGISLVSFPTAHCY